MNTVAAVIMSVLTVTTGQAGRSPSTVVIGRYPDTVCRAMALRYDRIRDNNTGIWYVALCNPEKAE